MIKSLPRPFGRHSLLTFITENDRIFSWSQTRTWDNYLTPSPPQPVKLPGLKVLAYTPVNSIFDDPTATLLSILCILIDILSCTPPKGNKGLSDFKFGTFICRFQSDGAASMAVKGLSTHDTTNKAKLIVKAQTLDIAIIRTNVAFCFVTDPLGIRQLARRTRNFSLGSTLSHHAPGLSLS